MWAHMGPIWAPTRTHVWAKTIKAPLGHPARDEQTPRGAPHEAKTIKAPLGHPAGDGKC